jgi:trans-aconitate 2-methyltransferase
MRAPINILRRRRRFQMTDWDAALYLKFEQERTRPAIDLLARISNENPRTCVDIGCGPGNSTELLVNRFPEANITGLDQSPGMLAAAKLRLPHVDFEQIDLTHWRPGRPYDVIFASASLQWLPDHEALFPRLASLLTVGGCLAVQMPDTLQADAGGHIPAENWLNQGLLWIPCDLVRFNRCLAHDLLSYAG